MVPFLLQLKPLLYLEYPWRSLLLALHGRGSAQGLFSMHRLNGFTCTWSVLSLPDANSEQGRSPGVTVGRR